ncbi:hypothetical protein E2562_001134 [Oryza meyeriana var. granulata]|uniref:Uncharacterized protein n=1 Tax=Oryza meyeriana var. granulata TaxID=110450 RepID=A0A6G1EFM3_9ORYZ|nr:hypothetical protein E2562_001134 [Oryza meyeriana var. granulata]
MAVLLHLDAVPGYYPAWGRAPHRYQRVVGLQEELDVVLTLPDADIYEVPSRSGLRIGERGRHRNRREGG